MAGALTPKQETFVLEYLKDLNGTQAAIRAGYSARTANEQSSRLLANANVSEAVSRARAERAGRLGLTADRVLEEIAAIAFARMPEYVEWGRDDQMQLKPSDELTDKQAAAVSQVVESEKFIKSLDHGDQLLSRERTIKLHDKLSALEKLCKHLGLMPDRKEISGPGGDAVQVEVKARDYREALGAFIPPAEEGES